MISEKSQVYNQSLHLKTFIASLQPFLYATILGQVSVFPTSLKGGVCLLFIGLILC